MICKTGFGDGHIVIFFGRKIERTSCTFKHLRTIFYLLERFNNVNTLGLSGKTLYLIDVSVIAIHASGGGGGGGGGGGFNWTQTLSKHQSWESFSKFPLLRSSNSQKSTLSIFFLIWLNHFYSTFLQIILYLMRSAQSCLTIFALQMQMG